MLGRHHDSVGSHASQPTVPQPIVIALHDERGDKATLLPDLAHLASRGFLCLSFDSPVTRRASAARDPLVAFDSQFEIALTALNLLHGDPDAHHPRTAFIGRGLGGEVASSVAAQTLRAQAVVAIASLPDRSDFVCRSTHPLAAGLRQFHDDDAVARQVAGLHPKRLVKQLETASRTSWMLQVADDDDRLSDEDRATLSLGIPRSVRVDRVAHARDLLSVQARRRRVDFITRLCG